MGLDRILAFRQAGFNHLVDRFLSGGNPADSAEAIAGFSPLSIDADNPFPSCGVGRLNDRVLDTSVLHDCTSSFWSPNIQLAAASFSK